MRSTEDVIKELEKEAGNFTGVGLVVGFDSTTTLIFANDPARLEKLNEAVNKGGEPIGFFGYDMHNGMLTVHRRAIAEHASEDWVKDYLDGFTTDFSTLLKANYNAIEIPDPEDEDAA